MAAAGFLFSGDTAATLGFELSTIGSQVDFKRATGSVGLPSFFTVK